MVSDHASTLFLDESRGGGGGAEIHVYHIFAEKISMTSLLINKVTIRINFYCFETRLYFCAIIWSSLNT